jgi:hypothetical protein
VAKSNRGVSHNPSTRRAEDEAHTALHAQAATQAGRAPALRKLEQVRVLLAGIVRRVVRRLGQPVQARAALHERQR